MLVLASTGPPRRSRRVWAVQEVVRVRACAHRVRIGVQKNFGHGARATRVNTVPSDTADAVKRWL